MRVSYVHLPCGSPLLKGHAHGGCNSSGYLLTTVLFTFPVVMTKHPGTLEGLILTPQFQVSVHPDGEVTKAAGHVTLVVKKQRAIKALYTHSAHLFCPGFNPGKGTAHIS